MTKDPIKRIAENVDKDLETIDDILGCLNMKLPRELLKRIDEAKEKNGFPTRRAYVIAVLNIVTDPQNEYRFTLHLKEPSPKN